MQLGVSTHNKGRVRTTKAARVCYKQPNGMRYSANQVVNVEKDSNNVLMLVRRTDTRGTKVIRIKFTTNDFRAFVGELMERF